MFGFREIHEIDEERIAQEEYERAVKRAINRMADIPVWSDRYKPIDVREIRETVKKQMELKFDPDKLITNGL